MEVAIVIGLIIAVVIIKLLLKSSTKDMTGNSSMTKSIPDNEIESLIRQGRTIEAIKLYRSKTGVGLKEGKDAVEKIIETMEL